MLVVDTWLDLSCHHRSHISSSVDRSLTWHYLPTQRGWLDSADHRFDTEDTSPFDRRGTFDPPEHARTHERKLDALYHQTRYPAHTPPSAREHRIHPHCRRSY